MISAAEADFAKFIQPEINQHSFSPAVLASANFDKSLFNSALYDQHDVYCPPAMYCASPKRQAEYFAGRYLAAQAMSYFDIHQFTLRADAKRCPQWPSTLVGSITHTNDYAACITALKTDVAAIGIDAQDMINDARVERLQSRIIDKAESSLLSQNELSPALGLSLCFSAKEAIYKALYPYVQQYFGFSAAKLHSIDPSKQTLTFRFDPALWVLHNDRNTLQLNYLCNDQRVLTYLILPASMK
ncbi:4'-phosphopantetheinyl transferase Npt [Zhongshania aliphaticivorans]|uniref:Enterobactin synthase component D n=1 Tax=Zhongshania aliphaticivorans TaxID=1470434 RepID=A0A5S9QJU7_9GAMM|nr:4'-phosphopantetheinyl transferase superfamily protein [Zhongshania aliphaticivorans]CAA0110248.1 4'-phosphopantetheinyl transferase Npt [Zhongshania aliphaticivorans]CAA0118049.1 4'-phosphopantetheinyl transferase Npt [Zhongshania aliphaticivorans]CAA0121970.1 4'-phosphopantetheinyl transferase Npt [Zhongshania aliphaticivorans]